MKFSTVVVAAGAAAVGYVLGTKAGRAQFEQNQDPRQRAGPRPQGAVRRLTVAGEVRKNAGRLPDPVAGVVRTAAEKVETATKTEPTPGTTGTSTSPIDPDISTSPIDPGTSTADPGDR